MSSQGSALDSLSQDYFELKPENSATRVYPYRFLPRPTCLQRTGINTKLYLKPLLLRWQYSFFPFVDTMIHSTTKFGQYIDDIKHAICKGDWLNQTSAFWYSSVSVHSCCITSIPTILAVNKKNKIKNINSLTGFQVGLGLVDLGCIQIGGSADFGWTCSQVLGVSWLKLVLSSLTTSCPLISHWLKQVTWLPEHGQECSPNESKE